MLLGKCAWKMYVLRHWLNEKQAIIMCGGGELWVPEIGWNVVLAVT